MITKGNWYCYHWVYFYRNYWNSTQNHSQQSQNSIKSIGLKPQFTSGKSNFIFKEIDHLTESVHHNPKSLADSYREQKHQINSRLMSSSGKENKSDNIQSQPSVKLYAGGRTKEQILAQRKQMMRPKVTLFLIYLNSPQFFLSQPNQKQIRLSKTMLKPKKYQIQFFIGLQKVKR